MMLPSITLAQTSLPTAGEALGNVESSTVQPTEYEFLPEDVDGLSATPAGLGVVGEQHSKTSSLIRVRANFVPEMLKSVENI